MKHRGKYGAGLLAVALIGVMAFAASAQAIKELASNFFINNIPVALKVIIEAKQLGRGTLLVPALNTEINCEKFQITNGFINNATDAEGSLLYEECTVLTITPELKEQPCHIVVNHTGDKRLHITAKALLLPAELNDATGGPAVLAEKIEATVLMEEGTECTLPKTTKITGELCLKIGNKIVEKKEVTTNHTTEPILESSEAIQKSCNPRLTLEGTEFSGTEEERKKLEAEGKGFLDKLLFGVNEAFVDGSADVFAGGVHAGFKLGVLLI